LRVAFRWNELAGSYRLSSALGLIGGAYQAWILPAVVADLFGVVHETPLGRRVLSNSIFSADDISVGWLASCLGGGSNWSVDSTYERRASGNTGILRNDHLHISNRVPWFRHVEFHWISFATLAVHDLCNGLDRSVVDGSEDPAWKATGFNLKRTANPGHLPLGDSVP